MLTPEALQNWSFAVCVSLLFVSCGACAVVDVIYHARDASECVKAEP